MSVNAFEMAAGLIAETFMYNRENFMYDRKQRQVMEYELADMRIEQVGLWREDVRDFCTLTPKKMEVYLLVTALELGFCIMALCKARVPPGAPPWLVSCHTLSVVGALMYLFLALWFGMHAFVSAQAYKVRILTQLVRLPVPTWKTLEGSRTYSSGFERIDRGQMLRVPFVTGRQEQHVPGARAPGAQGGGLSPSQDSPTAPGGPDLSRGAASDPWGLERRGDDVVELAPDVNIQTERQRHIWLVREAAKFYQTYDAFCRISMSAGTSNLATFFCYYCMTYVLTENASPIAAGGGMVLFIACALSLLRCDLMLTGWQYFVQGLLWFSSPALNYIVTYKSSKCHGHPGPWKCLIVLSLFLHGVSLVNYLLLFRVREMQTGAVLPTAFRRVLYIDPFGWAKHTGTWWKQLRTQLMLTRSRSFITNMRSMSSISLNSHHSEMDEESRAQLPTMQCVSSSAPRRPEDLDEPDQAGPGSRRGSGSELPHQQNISFRPGTFATTIEDDSAQEVREGIQTGTDIHGEKPGLVPWRIFFINTIFLAFAWEFAAGVSLARTVHGKSLFHPLKNATYGLSPGVVMPIPEMFGVRVETKWRDGLQNVRGLACSANGTVFLTSGRGLDGSMGLVQGRAVQLGGANQSVDFGGAVPCAEVREAHGPIQDLAIQSCRGDQACFALVLPKKGSHLVSCPLAAPSRPSKEAGAETAPTLPVGRQWLDDRGGVPPEGGGEGNLLWPEELSSVGSVPCNGEGGQGGAPCAVVGTTARRLVLLGVDREGGAGPRWLPTGLVEDDHGEVPEPGAFAVLGERYLGALQRKKSLLQVMDLHNGGAHMGTWRLPPAEEGSDAKWSSICASGNSFYALEDQGSPSLWRFPAPSELLAREGFAEKRRAELETSWPGMGWFQM